MSHQHLILQASVSPGKVSEESLREFLLNLCIEIGMEVLIDPVFKLSHANAWTGLMGITTSHISFHYWVGQSYLQFDIYSCKHFDSQKAILFINDFWSLSEIRAISIDREGFCKDFDITKITL